MKAQNDLGTVLNSTFVAHMKIKTRMESNRLARQSFGMLIIPKDRILFELPYACGGRRKKMNKIEVFKFGFFNLLKVSGTFGVDIAL